MSVIAVVPAQENNKYSENGDLLEWGETTLLEWKIAQVKEVAEVDGILVSTNSNRIAELVDEGGVSIIWRRSEADLTEVINQVCGEVSAEDHILWVNPTSPFLNHRLYSELINKFYEHGEPKDGVATARVMKEYFFDNKGKMNFDGAEGVIYRERVDEVYMLTNGGYIANCSSVRKRERMFGDNPIFYELSWLASLEVRESNDIDMFSALISKYFEDEI